MSTDDTTPTPAPVAVPEGGWRDGDWLALIDGRVWHVSDDALLHDERGRIMDADYVFRRGYVVYVHAPREAYGEPNDTTQHAPRREPVVAPLPTEAVRALAAALYRLEWEADLYATPRGATTERYERRARRLTAALPHLLPAADQRARDEGAVRKAVVEHRLHCSAQSCCLDVLDGSR
jgi:hypothetical protein